MGLVQQATLRSMRLKLEILQHLLSFQEVVIIPESVSDTSTADDTSKYQEYNMTALGLKMSHCKMMSYELHCNVPPLIEYDN
jgi:hypothetical protein